MSYFADIQNWFSGGFYGRHLGLILREIGNHRPEAFASFLSKKTGIPAKELKKARYECEFRFRGRRGIRSADLAVTIGDETIPRILVEIKYFDKPLPETDVKPAQFEDYRFWKSQDEGREVIVISRELYLADKLTVCRWNDLARQLKPFAEQSDLIQMLVEYLEEEGLVIQNIDASSLIRYFKRVVCPTWNAGVSANNIEGPVEFAKLLKNMKQFSGSFDVYFKNAWLVAKEKYDSYEDTSKVQSLLKAASIDFNIQNYVKESNISAVDENGLLKDGHKDGGNIYVFAQHALGSGGDKYIRINYGLRLVVSSDNKFSREGAKSEQSVPLCYLYARAWGKKIDAAADFYREKKVNFENITEKSALKAEAIDELLHELVREVVSVVLDAKPQVELVQKEALKELKRTLLKKAPKLVEIDD